MHLKMLALAVALLAPSVYGDNLPNQSFPVPCRIIYPNGKPAANAILHLDLINLATNTLTISSYKADKSGHVRYMSVPQDTVEQIQYCTAPAAVGFLQANDSGDNVLTFILRPTTRARIHFRDRYGKVLSNLKVSVTTFNTGSGWSSTGLTWDERIPGPWTQSTDSSGCSTFKDLPQGFALHVGTSDNHYRNSRLDKTILLSKVGRTPDADIILDRAGEISGAVLDGATNTPISGITVEAKGSRDAATAISDKNGKFTIGQLGAGNYRVAQVLGLEDVIHYSQITDWISDPQEVKINNTKDATGVTLRLYHGSVITGKVTDKETGTPVAGVHIIATHTAGQTPLVERDIRTATTDTDGGYSLRVSPGPATVAIQSSTRITHPLPQVQINTEEGSINSVNFQINASNYSLGASRLANHGIEAYANSEVEVYSQVSSSLLPPDGWPVVTAAPPLPRHAKRRTQR